MNITKIEYHKLINTGNYEHESLSVEVSLDFGESPHEAIKRAKTFVEAELIKRPTEEEWASAKRILENPDNYTGRAVKDAQRVKQLCEAPEEIPF